MHRIWRADKRAFYEHRAAMLWLEEFKPYIYPDGSRWSAPYPIALCESGGNYYASSAGAYGEIPPFPQYQPPKVQDEIAHKLMLEGKEYSAWVEWESGCPYR